MLFGGCGVGADLGERYGRVGIDAGKEFFGLGFVAGFDVAATARREQFCAAWDVMLRGEELSRHRIVGAR